MEEWTKRAVVRWIHIILAIPITGYIYSPLDLLHFYGPITRCIFVPIIDISGSWMWKDHLVRRLFARCRHNHQKFPLSAAVVY